VDPHQRTERADIPLGRPENHLLDGNIEQPEMVPPFRQSHAGRTAVGAEKERDLRAVRDGINTAARMGLGSHGIDAAVPATATGHLHKAGAYTC
jgi:hypothetical protein